MYAESYVRLVTLILGPEVSEIWNAGNTNQIAALPISYYVTTLYCTLVYVNCSLALWGKWTTRGARARIIALA